MICMGYGFLFYYTVGMRGVAERWAIGIAAVERVGILSIRLEFEGTPRFCAIESDGRGVYGNNVSRICNLHKDWFVHCLCRDDLLIVSLPACRTKRSTILYRS